MIYSIPNTLDFGRPFKRVVDAAGTEWNHCLYVDTVSGLIRKYAEDEHGDPVSDGCGGIKKEIVRVPAPVTVELACD